MASVRVLAHVHTRNDVAVIEQILDSLKNQIRPLDGIIIVDNGSVDATLDREFPAGVTVVRNGENLGTSGAIRIGLAHALEQGYDWTWIFDADSVPEPEALGNLLAFHAGLPAAEQDRVCFLASNMITATGVARDRPMSFTRNSIDYVPFDTAASHIKCDCFIWTGSLFRMASVAKIGLPSEHYVLDVAELEYGYRAMELGFQSYMVNGSRVHQDVGRGPGVEMKSLRLGPISIRLFEIPPIRCYYHVRNMLHFWLYQCRPRRPRRVIRSIVHGFAFPRTFLIRPVTHRPHLIACFRGLWDGLFNRMERRY